MKRHHRCTLLFALLLLFGLSVPAAAQPVYPSAPPSDAAQQDDDRIAIPSISLQQENFYLAVTEAAQPVVDNQQIADAVRQAMGESNAEIVVGVDRKPNSLKGAAQLVRGMTLFSDTSYLLMADDALEHGKDRGYIKPGWIAVGIMLPEDEHGAVEVAIEPGRNIGEAEPGAKAAALAAGHDSFTAGDWNQGIIDVAVGGPPATALPAPPDRTAWKRAGWIALGVLAAAGVAAGWIVSYRNRARSEAMGRARRGAELSDMIPALGRKLASRRLPAVPDAGPVSAARLAQLAAAWDPAVKAAAVQQPVEGNIGPVELKRLDFQRELLAGLNASVDALERLAGKGQWEAVAVSHRARLDVLVPVTQLREAAKLDSLDAVRFMLIDHVNRLEQPGASAGAKLETFWVLRDELEKLVDEVAADLKSAGSDYRLELSAFTHRNDIDTLHAAWLLAGRA